MSATALPTSVSDIPASVREELDTPMTVSDADASKFREDGFIKIRNVFSPETLAFFDPIVTATLREHDPLKDKPYEEKTTYERAFIQVGNIWQHNAVAAELSTSRRAASAAAQLMGVSGVRMYHDQALYKEAGGGFTPWHVDQHYWPLETPNTVTIWMPFTEVPIEKGPLMFGRGSHLRHIARDIAISEESEALIKAEIKKHKILEDFEGYALGEASFHYGWTLHRAGPNSTDDARRVLTVIYVEEDAVLAQPKTDAEQWDADNWMPGVEPGNVIDSPLNPILYSTK